MANDPAISVTDFATRIAATADSQEIGWKAGIFLGTRGKSAFADLYGGLNGMKPITEIMDFRALAGQEIVMTLDRPLGGQGTQGAATVTRLVGREEQTQTASYRAKVGVFAHAVGGEQIMKTLTVEGGDWDNRQRRKLTEYFAWKKGDDIQFEMIKREHTRNTIYPNNKAAIDDLTVNDTLNLTTVRSAQSMLNSNQAEPFSMVKVPDSGADVLQYLLMGPDKAFDGLSGSNQFLNLMSQADTRGPDNRLYKGGLPNWNGMRLYNWQIQDGTQFGPKAAPCAPVAYLGAALPATTTTTAQDITAGTTAQNAMVPPPLWFQYFRNAQYIGHEGEKIAADTDTVRYLAVKVISGSDTGKIALFSYKVNNGNKIVMFERLGDGASGSIVTTLTGSTITWNSGAWTTAAGANGFKGVTKGILPAGSIIYEVNSAGVPFVRSYALGRHALVAGYGSLAPLGANGNGGAGGGMPGQRLFQEQDHGRIFSVGFQCVWGCRATENADNICNGYVMVYSAWVPPGWPDVV
ncbi:MAG: hypothetical protein K8R87_07410 [Verrucomicrobia bacterium]|nr:hypothetical protein [Verrucomicrobiota bacterium]